MSFLASATMIDPEPRDLATPIAHFSELPTFSAPLVACKIPVHEYF